MAESIAHDVVKEAQSAGVPQAPSDDLASTSNSFSAGHGQALAKSNTSLPNGAANDGPVTVVDSETRSGKLEELADGSGIAQGDKLGGPVLGTGEFVTLAGADASGGSDSDTSKADTGKEDGKGHARSSSVRKPASFKPVSVTKSFLAKSSSSSPVVRSGDKAVPNSPSPMSALQPAKPRLVAKSALGGNGKGLIKVNGSGGPDASMVWNKNRPAPPAPPRQFTDEELTIKYGIHLAERLKADEPGKDSKWADIEDDEDDWAPETVEWMDGTKSNVGVEPPRLPVRVEEVPPAASATAKTPIQVEPEKPATAPVQKPIQSQSTKTILRPGAQLSASPKPGSGSKSMNDKSATGSSKPAPPPTKSPWAQLPPVEKVAPINPPIQTPQRAPFQRDPHGFDVLPPPPSAAEEIAADDFNRRWRDDRGTKELFNAHSGRYEPANDARRGSRHEPGYRQPAVLVRPSPQPGTNGPAEPSAAFQTSRQTIDGAPGYARRRASSSLSGPGGRRPSIVNHLQDGPLRSPHMDSAIESPQISHASMDRSGQWNRSGSVAQPPVQEQPSAEQSQEQAPESQEPYEDPVVKQQRMMKEKIERARLAKQAQMEKEAAEEAAKKERLRLKMEKLAAPTPSPETTASPAKEPASVPVQYPRNGPASPPKPPVPTSEGEVAQYGMMKVHQPHPVKKPAVNEASLTAKVHQDGTMDYNQGYKNPGSPHKAVARPTPATQPAPTSSRTDGPSQRRAQESQGTPQNALEKSVKSWKTSPAPNEYNWGPTTIAATARPGSNVWGPPGSIERSLGNGTFDSKFSHRPFDNRFNNSSSGPMQAQGSSVPAHGPIGSGIKPTSTPPLRQSQFAQTFQNLEKSQQEQPTSAPSQASSFTPPIIDEQAFASAHLDSSLQQLIAQTSSLHPHSTEPLQPASSQHLRNHRNNNNMSTQVVPASGLHGHDLRNLNSHDQARTWLGQDGRGASLNKWQNFKVDEDRRVKTDIARYKQNLNAHEHVAPAPVKSDISHYDVYEDFSETYIRWSIVTIQKNGEKSKVERGMMPKSAHNITIMKQSQLEHPEDHTLPQSSTSSKPAEKPEQGSGSVPPHLRGASKFFQAEQKVATPAQVTATNDEAPPPAEEGLFERNPTDQIKVKINPSIVVKIPGRTVSTPAHMRLPPASPGLDKSFSQTSAIAPPSGATKTLRASDLQAKFGPLNFASSFSVNTKPTFDVTNNARGNGAPRVNPPARVNSSIKSVFKTDQSPFVTSKPMAVDIVIEQPGFGSQPKVRLAMVAHQNHQFGYSHDSGMLAPSRPQSRFQKGVDSQTVRPSEAWLFPMEHGEKFGTKITIKTPGMQSPKAVDVHMKRHGHGSSGGPSPPNGQRKGNTRGGFNGSANRRGPTPQGLKNDRISTAPQANPPRAANKPYQGSNTAHSASSSRPRGWAPRSGANNVAGN